MPLVRNVKRCGRSTRRRASALAYRENKALTCKQVKSAITGHQRLFAFVAWQTGDGTLANLALDRALADDPGYSMAELLRQVICSGAPAWMARLPMIPEEVTACYEGPDDDDDGEEDEFEDEDEEYDDDEEEDDGGEAASSSGGGVPTVT